MRALTGSVCSTETITRSNALANLPCKNSAPAPRESPLISCILEEFGRYELTTMIRFLYKAVKSRH
jgi:hypothetical protein